MHVILILTCIVGHSRIKMHCNSSTLENKPPAVQNVLFVYHKQTCLSSLLSVTMATSNNNIVYVTQIEIKETHVTKNIYTYLYIDDFKASWQWLLLLRPLSSWK